MLMSWNMTEKTGWPLPALMQDDHRGLFKWFASKPDARRLVREEAERIKMVKAPSQWLRTMDDFKFPDTMPQELREKVIRLRRQIMTYGYILHGLGIEIIGDRLWSRLCKELTDLQSAWGWEFNFYDFQFKQWDETWDDKLSTNLGWDQEHVKHAMHIVKVRKEYDRKHKVGAPA
jgi:hypothetical protein